MAAHIPTPEELFRMSGSDLKELAGGRGRAATAAQTEIERRQAKKAAKQAALFAGSLSSWLRACCPSAPRPLASRNHGIALATTAGAESREEPDADDRTRERIYEQGGQELMASYRAELPPEIIGLLDAPEDFPYLTPARVDAILDGIE